MSNMGSSHVTEGSGETTEWQDILRAKGIIAPAAPTERERRAAISDALEKAAEAAEAARDKLAEASLEELDDLAAGDDEAGERGRLEAYRAARLRALREAAAAQKFGRVYPLSRAEFVREVTDASKSGSATGPSVDAGDDADGGGNSGSSTGTWVVVLLYKPGLESSRRMEELFPRLADRHRATKFMQIIADQCIEGFPDRNVPALLVYHGGVCRQQLIGAGQFGGARMTVDTIEWVLSRHGAVKTELEDDPRIKFETAGGGGIFTRAGAGRRRGGDDDDDDDN